MKCSLRWPRAAMSSVIYEVLDFGVAITDADGEAGQRRRRYSEFRRHARSGRQDDNRQVPQRYPRGRHLYLQRSVQRRRSAISTTSSLAMPVFHAGRPRRMDRQQGALAGPGRDGFGFAVAGSGRAVSGRPDSSRTCACSTRESPWMRSSTSSVPTAASRSSASVTCGPASPRFAPVVNGGLQGLCKKYGAERGGGGDSPLSRLRRTGLDQRF